MKTPLFARCPELTTCSAMHFEGVMEGLDARLTDESHHDVNAVGGVNLGENLPSDPGLTRRIRE